MTDFSQHLFYTPSRGDALMSRISRTVFSVQGDQALYAIQEVYLTGFEWVQVFSYNNNTNTAVKRTITTTTGLVTTTGSEISTELSLGAAFKGISMNIGTTHKSFSSQEVSNTTSISTEITCEPNKITYYFQRRYKFRTYVWYICDAWNELSRVGGMGNYNPTYSQATDEIMSEDYLLTNIAPQGSSYFDASPRTPPASQPFKWTRQFNNVTERSKNYLKGLANRNMAFISGYNVSRSLISEVGVAAAKVDSEDIGTDHALKIGEIVSMTKASATAPPA